MLTFSLLIAPGCKKNTDVNSNQSPNMLASKAKKTHLIRNFTQTNLVDNNGEYHALHTDPTLINAWGIAFGPTGIAWVNAQGGHVSELYSGEGVVNPGLPRVNIPSPGSLTSGGNPTGIVFSASTTDFKIPSATNPAQMTAARFIFVGVDGVVSAWNGTRGTTAYRVANNVATSAYTGLALATNSGQTYLYAADFRAGRIAVWDNNWNAVTSFSFMDPNLPAGYSPFNIQNINGQLYVTYVKVGPDGRSQAGAGLGYVDLYNPNGTLVKRFASVGTLDAPWGLVWAPSSFISDDEDDDTQGAILVGNFGDGHINAYRPSDGKFLGQLSFHKMPIVIEGLWALTFAPSTSTISQGRLYFAAGPDHEEDGLFGYITRAQDDND